MPFEEAETIDLTIYKASQGSVSYMRSRRKRKGDREATPYGQPRLIIAIPTTIFLSQRKRWLLLIGSGEDAHKIRIKATRNDDKKGTEAKTLKHAVMLRFGHVPKFGDEIFDRVAVQAKTVASDEYEIELPFDPSNREHLD